MSVILTKKLIGNARIVTVLCVLMMLMVTGYSFQAISNYIESRNQIEQEALKEQIQNYRDQVASLTTQMSTMMSTMQEQQQYLQMKLEQKQEIYPGKQVMVEQGVGSVLNIEATAYVSTCPGCTGITKTGVDVRTGNHRIIAVDPAVVPLDKKVELIINGKNWGIWETQDTGGDIKGFRVDILMPTVKQALRFGRQTVVLKIVE